MEISNIKNDALLKAFNEMRTETTDLTKTAFFNELRKATYVTAAVFDKAPEQRPDGKYTIAPDTKINFRLLTNKNGDKYFPAFTDVTELKKFPDSQQTQAVTVTFNDYVRFLANDSMGMCGIVINPFTQNIIIPKEIIQQIAHAKMTTTVKEMKIDKPTNIQLGQPNKYPTEMVEKIKTVLANKKNVKGAFLQLMRMNEEFSFLLIVEFDKGEDKAVYEEIAKASVPYLKGIHLQMIPRESELGKKATENLAPFYIRKRKFFK